MKCMKHRYLAIAMSTTLLLGGCATLPSNTDPHVLRPYQEEAPESEIIGPIKDREPDLLLRDFYAASAIPTGDYEAARAFLTEAAKPTWSANEQTLIVDRIGLNTVSGSSGNKRSFAVHGNVVGALGSGGVFTPERGTYEATLELEQVDGQWRISSLPPGVVMERTELRNQYQPYNLYFFDPTGKELVTDRRWVYAPRDFLPSTLISLLLEGPASRLRPAIMGTIPSTVRYTGFEGGAYHFAGLGNMDEAARSRFAAQVVWTLASAGVTGPFSLLADGEPLITGARELTTDDFIDVSPVVEQVGESTLYSLADGHVSQITGGGPQPVAGVLGNTHSVVTADISGEGQWAAVFNVGDGPEGAELRLGQLTGGSVDVVKAETFSRPSFEPNSKAVWTVSDGKHILRSTQSSATGEVTTEEVHVDLPEDVDGNISVLRLSRSGSRVVMVIDGRLYTGIIEQRAAGAGAIVNVLEYSYELGGSVVSVDWHPDGSLIVGTSNPASPVMRVEQDGSSTTALSLGNISAPVVAVAASPNMLYATDANAILQMPVSGADTPIWREVPGLQGVRSLPIIAR